jgi:hypothetical protein
MYNAGSLTFRSRSSFHPYRIFAPNLTSPFFFLAHSMFCRRSRWSLPLSVTGSVLHAGFGRQSCRSSFTDSSKGTSSRCVASFSLVSFLVLTTSSHTQLRFATRIPSYVARPRPFPPSNPDLFLLIHLQLFLEPKILYRSAVEQVPIDDYELPLSSAEVLKEGSDLTIISWGPPLYTIEGALHLLKHPSADIEKLVPESLRGLNVELIDLRTIIPYDVRCSS